MSLTAQDFAHLDIPSVVEQYTSTRLTPARTQCTGACPYDDCPGDTDGFIVFYELSKHGRHYMCRTCKRTGDIVKLIQDIKGISFPEACNLLEIGQGKPALHWHKARERKRKGQSEQERAILADIARTTRRGLQHERVQAYLVQRGIPLEIAYQYGLCYIPSFKELSEDLQCAWWSMRQWTDRVVFPLSGAGFTGRTLFLWVPGMDENEHKTKLDAFNRRVQLHNERMRKQYGKDASERRKLEIPRWYTSAAGGYFHGDVLTICEHVTIVEGPFDALALLAGGVTDVVAAGRNGMSSDHIPVNVCFATLAFDGDEKGQRAAREHEKVFRRRGIKTWRCTPPEDDKGKDWSERYRLHGVEGLRVLLKYAHDLSHEQSQGKVSDFRSLSDSHRATEGKTSEPDGTDEVAAALSAELPLCSICLDTGRETVALPEAAGDGLMYCAEHQVVLQEVSRSGNVDEKEQVRRFCCKK